MAPAWLAVSTTRKADKKSPPPLDEENPFVHPHLDQQTHISRTQKSSQEEEIWAAFPTSPPQDGPVGNSWTLELGATNQRQRAISDHHPALRRLQKQQERFERAQHRHKKASSYSESSAGSSSSVKSGIRFPSVSSIDFDPTTTRQLRYRTSYPSTGASSPTPRSITTVARSDRAKTPRSVSTRREKLSSSVQDSTDSVHEQSWEYQVAHSLLLAGISRDSVNQMESSKSSSSSSNKFRTRAQSFPSLHSKSTGSRKRSNLNQVSLPPDSGIDDSENVSETWHDATEGPSDLDRQSDVRPKRHSLPARPHLILPSDQAAIEWRAAASGDGPRKMVHFLSSVVESSPSLKPARVISLNAEVPIPMSSRSSTRPNSAVSRRGSLNNPFEDVYMAPATPLYPTSIMSRDSDIWTVKDLANPSFSQSIILPIPFEPINSNLPSPSFPHSDPNFITYPDDYPISRFPGIRQLSEVPSYAWMFIFGFVFPPFWWYGGFIHPISLFRKRAQTRASKRKSEMKTPSPHFTVTMPESPGTPQESEKRNSNRLSASSSGPISGWPDKRGKEPEFGKRRESRVNSLLEARNPYSATGDWRAGQQSYVRWRSLCRIMSVFSVFEIAAIIGILIWTFTS